MLCVDIGLLYIAIFYYEKALALEPVVSGPQQVWSNFKRVLACSNWPPFSIVKEESRTLVLSVIIT